MTSGDASFVIDHDQRILQWSAEAAAVLGVPEEMAIGQPCYEVVQGRDSRGRPVCQPNCLAANQVRSGYVTGSCRLLLKGNGARSAFLCKLIALPERLGGSVGLLKSAGPANSTDHHASGSATDTVHDLAALGSLSAAIAGEPTDVAFERTLDWLRQSTGAEVAELFLAEPEGGDVVLTSFRGPHSKAFFQITRFRTGEGFPGLVVATGTPIVSKLLAQDERYLRVAVKEKGFRTYVCMPVYRAGEVAGAMNVASKDGEIDVERAQHLLTWASTLVGGVLERALLEVGSSITDLSLTGHANTSEGLEDLARVVLRRMMALGGASTGSLSILNANHDGASLRVTEGSSDAPICKAADPSACPALVEGHSVALEGPRYRWALPCQGAATKGELSHCVPLIAYGEHVGLVQMRYPDMRPSPATHHLALLGSVASRAAQALKRARDSIEEREKMARYQTVLVQKLGERLGVEQAHKDVADATTDADGQAHPFLDLRCLGPFRIYRQGSLITPDMIRRRGSMTLLKVLLTRAGRAIPRDEIAEIMWPETDPQLTTNRLFVLVHTLRQLVEPEPRERGWAFVCGDGDYYRFNTGGACYVDFLEFRKHVFLGERLQAEGDIAGSISIYEKALALYRGDFLEDDPYAEWCWEERETLRERYLNVVLQLASLQLGQGKTQRAIDLYQMGLKTDPLREEMYRGLMHTLWLAGRRSEALRQYRLCEEVLERELGVAPGPEVLKVLQQIRNE